MESKKYNSIAVKIKKWAKGKADNDYELFYAPAQKILEDFLNDNMKSSNDIMKLVQLNNALEVTSWWNYHNFLDLYLNSNTDNVKEIYSYLSEAEQFRILKSTLGFTKPQNIGPMNEGQLACTICDAILLSDKLGDRLIEGYAGSLIFGKPPQINPNSVIQYAHALYYLLKNDDSIDLSNIFKKPLVKQYSELLENIFSPNDIFENKLIEACEFHLEHSKSNMSYEFNLEENMLIPSELYATLKLRESKSFELPNLQHPLIANYKNLYSEKEVHSVLYLNVLEKIETEYLT